MCYDSWVSSAGHEGMKFHPRGLIRGQFSNSSALASHWLLPRSFSSMQAVTAERIRVHREPVNQISKGRNLIDDSNQVQSWGCEMRPTMYTPRGRGDAALWQAITSIAGGSKKASRRISRDVRGVAKPPRSSTRGAHWPDAASGLVLHTDALAPRLTNIVLWEARG